MNASQSCQNCWRSETAECAVRCAWEILCRLASASLLSPLRAVAALRMQDISATVVAMSLPRCAWLPLLLVCGCGAESRDTTTAEPTGLDTPAEASDGPAAPDTPSNPSPQGSTPSDATGSPSVQPEPLAPGTANPQPTPEASGSNGEQQPDVPGPSDPEPTAPVKVPTAPDSAQHDAGAEPAIPAADGGAPLGEPVEEELAAVPTPRGEHGVAALDGEVYVLGGFTPTVTASVQAYSPEQDSWRDVADFPVVFHHPNIATLNGRLYVLGFHAGMGQRVADGRVYSYDPGANEWQQHSSQPTGTERGASCLTTYEDRIYVFGGTNDVAMPDASIYDPASDSWEVLPFMPALRHHCIAAEVDGQIYVVSGRDVVITEVQVESYVFDPVALSWNEVAPIPTPRGGAAGGVLDGRIYVFGGEGNPDDPRGIFHEAEVYDPATDTWSSLPDMTVPRHGFGAAVIGERMYLPGGSISQGIDVQATHSVFFFETPQ